MKEFIDEIEGVVEGTALNRANLMAAQGFNGKEIGFSSNSITETNSDGETLTTTFNQDGTITEILVGQHTITKTITFNSDGSISEVLS